MDSNSQDNTDAFCRAIDYCRRNPGTRLVIDAGEYRFSPKNTIGLNSLKDVLIDAEGAVFVFDCDRYFEISIRSICALPSLTKCLRISPSW